MSIRVLEAITLANKLHRGQKRKGSGEAYIGHPVAVSYLVAHYKRSKYLEDLLIAAILHDVVEDAGYPIWKIAKQFGGLVSSLVQELTNDPTKVKLLGKRGYQEQKLLGISSFALVIKLCDRLHNISDNPSRQMVLDTVQICNTLCIGRKLSKTHSRIITDIQTACSTILHNSPEVTNAH